jgi:hypothetical protein
LLDSIIAWESSEGIRPILNLSFAAAWQTALIERHAIATTRKNLEKLFMAFQEAGWSGLRLEMSRDSHTINSIWVSAANY